MLLIIVLVMSSPVSPGPSRSRPSTSRDEPALGARGQDYDELATRMEQQHAKIRAHELAAEERRRFDELCLQEQARRAESRKQYLRQERLARTISTKDRRLLS